MNRLSALAALLLLLLPAAPAWAFRSAGYFPLTFGNSWQYNYLSGASLNGSTISGTVIGPVSAVVPASVTPISGADARTIIFTGPANYQSYFTNDSNGIRQYRELDFNVAVNFGSGVTTTNASLTLGSGFQIAPVDALLGQQFSSSGTATFNYDAIPNCGALRFQAVYSGSSTIQGFQSVTVPAGTFDTVVILQTITISGTANSATCDGSPVEFQPPLVLNDTSSSTTWAADNVGLVQQLDSDGTAIVLTGYAVPSLSPSVSNLQFRQPFNTTSPPQLVTLTSSGSTSLNSPFISMTNPPGQGQFVLASNDCPPSMAPGTQCTIGITYTPELFAPGAGEAQIFINNDLTFPYHVVKLSGTNAPHLHHADFDGNGNSDVFWKHAVSTQTYVWQMNGASIAGSGSPASTGDPKWEVKGIGDFNGDGKADVLFRHSQTGATILWLMNGTAVSGTSSPGTIADLDWQVQGVGDFNGDGRADILWQHADGTVVIWLMNAGGTAIASTGSPANLGPASGWAVQGVGDFDGDGKADILWKHANGTVVMWRMNGASIASSAVVAGVGDASVGWTVQGVGDFNGDLKADVLWRNDVLGGIVYVWLMNGSTIASAANVTGVGTEAGTGWVVKSIGDYDDDGKSDILWKNDILPGNEGITYVWLMNGASIRTAASVTGVADFNWQVQNPK